MAYFIVNSMFVFIFGAILGSFFNVCIYRLPLEQSIAWPPSHCPGCHAPIAWYDNIPIVSFFALKGRCRHCQSKFTSRYLIVEALSAFVFLWIWFSFGCTVHALTTALIFSLLLIATFVDLEHQIIPDEVSLGGLGAGLFLSAIFPSLHGESVWWRSLIQATIGALLGGGMIYLTGVIGDFVFRKESMGGGDVKLLAMLGAFLGWKQVILIYFLSPILALPLGLFLKFAKRMDTLPFGPFISLAGWIALLWGEKMIAWYWHGVRF